MKECKTLPCLRSCPELRSRDVILLERALKKKKKAQKKKAGLGEFRIDDLNDEISKLLREKGHWEVR